MSSDEDMDISDNDMEIGMILTIPISPSEATQFASQESYSWLQSLPASQSQIAGGIEAERTKVKDVNLLKVENILNVISCEAWTIGEFLYFFSHAKDENGVNITGHSSKHGRTLGIFLSGRSNYTPARIIEEWIQHPLGIPNKEDAEYQYMFSVLKPYEDIGHAHPALTSFVAQLVEEHLLTSPIALVSPDGGLRHASGIQSSGIGDQKFGAETLHSAQDILRMGHPLLWHYCILVATPKQRNRLSHAKNASNDTHTVSRNYRPPETYVKADQLAILKIASSDDESGVLRFNNMQKQVKAWFEHIVHETHMLIGCARTYCRGEGLTKDVLSLIKKREWLEKNLCAKLMFGELWDLVDHKFLSDVLPLEWLAILFDYMGDIPDFQTYSVQLQGLYHQIGTKQKVSPQKTQIYLLKSNGYNETGTEEHLKALIDFLTQLGQSPGLGSYAKCLVLAGGTD
ncbi:hypothetical protein BDP27DRAFT_1425613 [Rhodocollybia butyracea]|uniref:DUF6589 domain-containing protein n=1 Tax=Rhodocollybia butyracea TaxID=206335 RepID=A0A9P5U3K2_9AGAR|nr:hypothetical protein BDP27DRAFT_1425613 [Rhodocollybia butyracea]